MRPGNYLDQKRDLKPLIMPPACSKAKVNTERCRTNAETLWIFVVVFWSAGALFILREFDIVQRVKSSSRGIAFAYCALFICAVLSWIFGLYYLIVAAIAARRANSAAIREPAAIRDRVAILYPTMNDFSRQAALSCIYQDYQFCDIFLCDDSTAATSRAQVDSFHKEFPQRSTVLRRPAQTGFKAGNLNHCLKQICDTYSFFVVNDADGILPSNFISAAILDFEDDRVGFVQTRQATQVSDTAFGRWLDAIAQVHWSTIVPFSAKFGFLMFHGHGGIVRTAAWSAIGGFPEVVSEDLAMSTEMRRFGYRGVLSEGIVCSEEFPQSFAAFARRQLKYCTGTFEHLLRYMWPFLAAREVPWYEKVDRMLATAIMLSPVLLLIATIALTVIGLGTGAHRDAELYAVGSSKPHLLMWCAIAGWLAPLIPALVAMWRIPARLLRYIAACMCVHIAMTPALAAGLVRTIILGRAEFPVTGDVSRR